MPVLMSRKSARALCDALLEWGEENGCAPADMLTLVERLQQVDGNNQLKLALLRLAQELRPRVPPEGAFDGQP